MEKEQFVDIQTGKVTVKESDIKEVAVTVDESLIQLRMIRNNILAQSDWIVIKEREEGGTVTNFTDWKKYRQDLRDITNQTPTDERLSNITFPKKPS